MNRFPEGFLWGAATSAHQVEGSPLADGAGPSIWYRFAHTPGLTTNGDTGDVACDHYHRFPEDVALLADLGLNAYRFSISWSRILPAGRGAVNPRGLAFYDRLVDALLARGIQPVVTLYHWDLPAALDDRGGWLNPDIADWFADYTRVMVRALDDRVKLWATLNEPWVVADGGYLHGALAPGHRNLFEAPLVTHNLLRAHAAGVEAYRAEGKHQVGIVLNLEPKYPASEDPRDVAATRRADAYMNRQYLEPVLRGAYPAELAEIFGPAWPEFPAADLKRISQPIDFLGINYYTRGVTRHDDRAGALPLKASSVRQPQALYTGTDWEVYPAGLTDTLKWVRERSGDLPKTAPSSLIQRRRRTGASTIRCASNTTGRTSRPPSTRCGRACRCVATSPGRCSTTSSGATATRSASGSCTWTSRRSAAPSRRAGGSTPTWCARAARRWIMPSRSPP